MVKQSKPKRPTFIVKGKTYLAEPDMNEFLKEAGVSPSIRTRIKNNFLIEGIQVADQLFDMTLDELTNIDQISTTMSKRIYEHAMRIKRKGAFVIDFNE